MITLSSLQPGTRKALAYGLTAALASVIVALTLLPLPTPPLATDGGDKVYHFIAFAGLMLPVASLRPMALIWMIPAALLFGAGIEILQPFVNRSRDLADFLADAAGVLAGAAFGAALNRFS
ncbi:MAG: VanZ family protein [Yoonia sp.]